MQQILATLGQTVTSAKTSTYAECEPNHDTMDIPPSRKREFQEKEISFVREAIAKSGLKAITPVWSPHSVQFNGVAEIQPVLFDCRGLLDAPCWIVRRISVPGGARTCSCGTLVREAAEGTHGSLKEAVAAAMAEIVRSRVLANIADCSEPILRERPSGQPAACSNDFITHCVHT